MKNMSDQSESTEQIWVTTVDDSASRRDMFRAKIEVETLTENMTKFINQIDRILSETPDTVQKFQLIEFAVEAQISGKGQLVLLGAGGEVGGSGGLKFVFRKVDVPSSTSTQAVGIGNSD
jgi:hypothetical protein